MGIPSNITLWVIYLAVSVSFMAMAVYTYWLSGWVALPTGYFICAATWSAASIVDWRLQQKKKS